MRKLIAILFLLCACSFAADVRAGGGVKYGVLTGLPAATVIGRNNQQWANINNAYIMDNIAPDSGVCFSFVNNDSSSHTATVTAFTTSTLLAPAFGAGGNDWIQVPISPPIASSLYTFAASAQTQLYVRTPGAAHTVLLISGATGAPTVRIDFAQTGAGCGSVNQWRVVDAVANNAACNTSNAVIAGVVGVRHVANCVSVSIANTSATALSSNWDIRDGGVAGNCTAGTIVWTAVTAVPVAPPVASTNVAVCGLNISSAVGNSLQVCFEATPGANQSCRSSMSGYDQ